MAVSLYMDHNVEAEITARLRRSGIDVITAREDERDTHEDPVIFDRAVEMGRILFTHDQDFLALATQRQRAGMPFPGVVFARQRKVFIGLYVAELEIIALAGNPVDFENQVVHLPS